MKLGKAVSWLLGTLQRSLFPQLEECWKTPLTTKEQQLVTILEMVRIEKHVPRSASTQSLGRKLREREAVARSFVAKAVYGHPFTRTTSATNSRISDLILKIVKTAGGGRTQPSISQEFCKRLKSINL